MKKRLRPKIKPNWKSGDRIPKHGIYGWFNGEDKNPWFDILIGQLKVNKKMKDVSFYYTLNWEGSNYFKPATKVPYDLKYTKRGLEYRERRNKNVVQE